MSGCCLLAMLVLLEARAREGDREGRLIMMQACVLDKRRLWQGWGYGNEAG